jgi:hypothetical protein
MQACARDLGEEALDEIQPGGSGRGEVEMNPRVLREPRLHGGMLVRAVTSRRLVADRGRGLSWSAAIGASISP